MNTPEMTNEQKAIELGKDRNRLLARLKDAVKVLNKDLHKHFNHTHFDFEKKALISMNSKYRLVWSIRENPDQPESYLNQQTNQGCVQLVKE